MEVEVYKTNIKCREFLEEVAASENYLWDEVKKPSKYLISSSFLFHLIEDIIYAVEYLQEKRVRHDNINPSNILIFEGPSKNRPLCAKLSNISSHSTSALRNPETGAFWRPYYILLIVIHKLKITSIRDCAKHGKKCVYRLIII
jgi:serine/threonine protein kinase